jgi:hypothetical protein
VIDHRLKLTPDINFCGSSHSVTAEQPTRESVTSRLSDEVGRHVSCGAVADRPHRRRHRHGAHPCLLAGRDIREVNAEAIWDNEATLRLGRR